MKTKEELYLPLDNSFFRPVLKGLWDDETTGKIIHALIDHVINGTDPNKDDFEPFAFCYLEDAIQFADSKWTEYAEKAKKNAHSGHLGGLAKARKASNFEYHEDSLEDFPGVDSSERLANASERLANKNKKNPEAGAFADSKNALADNPGDLALAPGTPDAANARPLEAAALPPGSGPISLEEAIRCATTNKVNLTADGIRAWHEKMEADGWKINGARVTRKTMLKAMRGFAKNFQQWQKGPEDPGEDPGADRKAALASMTTEDLIAEFDHMTKCFFEKQRILDTWETKAKYRPCNDEEAPCVDCEFEDECEKRVEEKLKVYLGDRYEKATRISNIAEGRGADYFYIFPYVVYSGAIFGTDRDKTQFQNYMNVDLNPKLPGKNAPYLPLEFIDEWYSIVEELDARGMIDKHDHIRNGAESA